MFNVTINYNGYSIDRQTAFSGKRAGTLEFLGRRISAKGIAIGATKQYKGFSVTNHGEALVSPYRRWRTITPRIHQSIVNEYTKGDTTQQALADKYGTYLEMVRRIVTGKRAILLPARTGR